VPPCQEFAVFVHRFAFAAAAAAVLFVSDLGLGPLAGTCHAAATTAATQHRPEVLMYATRECPYCAKARAYFQAHGVAFREIDIDASAQARQEWQDKGGRGTPLIYVDGQRIEGFVAAKLDAALAPYAPPSS
jgi:glutaredoxin